MTVFLRDKGPSITPQAVIEALENENDRQILAMTQERAVTAQEIIDHTGVSKSTAYRRIQRLQELGLLVVESGTMRAGHPMERYRARLASATLAVEEGEVRARWRLSETADERLHRLWSQLRGEG